MKSNQLSLSIKPWYSDDILDMWNLLVTDSREVRGSRNESPVIIVQAISLKVLCTYLLETLTIFIVRNMQNLDRSQFRTHLFCGRHVIPTERMDPNHNILCV